MKQMDRVGKVYGKVLIVSIADSYRTNHDRELRRKTICKCLVCNKTFIVKRHEWPSDCYKSGCLSCSRKAKGLRMRKLPGHAGFISLYRRYTSRCRNSFKGFYLTKEQFRYIVQDNCHYCGMPPMLVSVGSNCACKEHSRFTYNTIDRLDNNVGYTPGNSVACCKECNLMKRVMTKKEFLEHIERIHVHSMHL